MEKNINLEEFANGALAEKINQALREVTNNVQDPNTNAKAKRKITCTFTFSPTEQRDLVAASIDVKTSLAPSLGIATAFVMGKDVDTNEVDFREYSNQVRGQLNINDYKQVAELIHSFTGGNQQEVTDEMVDPDTGEILEADQVNNVVDLRAAR